MAKPVFNRGNLVAKLVFFSFSSQKVVALTRFAVARSAFLYVLHGKCRTDFVQSQKICGKLGFPRIKYNFGVAFSVTGCLV